MIILRVRMIELSNYVTLVKILISLSIFNSCFYRIVKTSTRNCKHTTWGPPRIKMGGGAKVTT